MSIPLPPIKTYTFDVECYANYFLLTVYDAKTGEVVREFEMYNNHCNFERHEVATLLHSATIVSFNGNKYDLLVITAFIAGATNRELKAVGDEVIKERMMPWIFERKYNIKIPKYDHIDLIEVAFGVASLKIYGAKLRAKLLQELPIHFDNIILPHQPKLLRSYCINDNVVTTLLLENLQGAIDLRIVMGKKYGMDLRSKSDAQIGEGIMVSETERINKTKMVKPNVKTMQRTFSYKSPDWVYFQTVAMRQFLAVCEDTEFKLSAKNVLLTPKALNTKVTLGDKQYQFGIGGIHSIGDKGSHYTTDDEETLQIDVGSFYPRIILNGGFYPPQIGKETFDTIYRGWCDQRDAAKLRVIEIDARLEEIIDSNDPVSSPEQVALRAEKIELNELIATIKIILNGIYGKFGSPYSKVFAPGMLLHVTVSGQLAILMLIEQLVVLGITVLSSNTDGITVKIKRNQREPMNEMVKWWCGVTGFTMDYDEYKSIHYRDVNNYFAHYQNDKVKGIGLFAAESLRINPSNFIIRDAIFNYVKDGTPIEDTINNCEDVHLFITVKKVNGGATKDGENIGAAIRWYRSNMTNTAIHYANLNCHGTSYNKVGGSDCGMPLMNYPDDMLPPVDVDREWYIKEAYRVMAQTGLLGEAAHYYQYSDAEYHFVRAAAIDDPIFKSITRDQFIETLELSKADIKKCNA